MIKVKRIEKPAQLTKELQMCLTEEFKKDKKKRVWDKSYIREGLLKECNKKCVYCECLIGGGEKEMHVDHFHYKDKYEDEVVDWNNLNPSCPHCNKQKSYHDTYIDPIINPFEQDPKDYFYIKDYRYYSRNDQVEKIVRETIDVLGLNDTQELVWRRFEQGEALKEKILEIYRLASESRDILSENTSKRNRVLRGCKNMLQRGIETAEYAAFMATIIKEDDYYKKLKNILMELKLWDEELNALDEKVEALKMESRNDEIS